MNKKQTWEDVLSSCARLQEALPQAIVVGGTSAVIYAQHRISFDHDHVITDLKNHYDEILEELKSVSGWKIARTKRPVLVLGSLDGVETGIRQLIRSRPLETTEFFIDSSRKITLPTPREVLRIKTMLTVKRNAMRDYIDTVAIADWLNKNNISPCDVLKDIGLYYEDGDNLKQQIIAQFASPVPYDFSEEGLKNYKAIVPPYDSWEYLKNRLGEIAVDLAMEKIKSI